MNDILFNGLIMPSGFQKQWLHAFIVLLTAALPVEPLFGWQREQAQDILFPIPSHTRHQMKFWETIFNRYPSHTMVIHDSDFPAIILDVIDFEAFAKRYRSGSPYSRKEKNKLVGRYLKRYQKAIQRLAKEGTRAFRYGAMEKRVFKVYSQHREAKKNMLSGRASIRSQSGLKDEFALAAKRAESYLPYMEAIFRSHGIPVELTRMAFVESMFNTKAVSKVGASGIWQFMPSTGKLYMTVHNWIDERNSPLKATVAAARLLKDNYQALQSWPLAITAYNHGAGGMKRAIRKLRTKDMGAISKRYSSQTFGFASRNFYAEFLAARSIYERFYRQGRRFQNRNPQKIVKLKLKGRQTIAQLIKHTPLTAAIIKHHNPDLSHRAFTSRKHHPLPKNFQLIVPDAIAHLTRHSIHKLAQNDPRHNRSNRW